MVCYCSIEQGQSIEKPQLSFWVLSSTPFSEREGFKKKKKGNWGFWLKLGGEGSEGVVQPVTWSVYMLIKAKNAQKLQYYLITGPKLVGGGVRGASAKSPSIIFF